ncbi:MAG TPA: hypothetical protein VKZ18_07640 [Polyangia bacterium]|nr:hypothetical protein [Polyangia bacterium]
MNGCPSEFALDQRQLQGGADPALALHLDACASCQARLAARRASVAEFEQTLAAPTWTRIEAERRARRRAPRFARLFSWAALGAAAASVLYVAVPYRRSAVSTLTPKGSALAQVVCRRGGQTFVVGPGAEVAPGDALRFLPLPVWPQARYIQVGSVDGTGAYVPFYPAAAAESVALPPRGAALEGSIQLDDAPGPERLFFVLSAVPLSTREVAQAALAHVGAGDRVQRIAGREVVTGWVVLPKRRGGAPASP